MKLINNIYIIFRWFDSQERLVWWLYVGLYAKIQGKMQKIDTSHHFQCCIMSTLVVYI